MIIKCQKQLIRIKFILKIHLFYMCVFTLWKVRCVSVVVYVQYLAPGSDTGKLWSETSFTVTFYPLNYKFCPPSAKKKIEAILKINRKSPCIKLKVPAL